MTNPTTIDRRDVAHTTHPIGRRGYVEEINTSNAAALLDDADRLDEFRVEGRSIAAARSLRAAH